MMPSKSWSKLVGFERGVMSGLVPFCLAPLTTMLTPIPVLSVGTVSTVAMEEGCVEDSLLCRASISFQQPRCRSRCTHLESSYTISRALFDTRANRSESGTSRKSTTCARISSNCHFRQCKWSAYEITCWKHRLHVDHLGHSDVAQDVFVRLASSDGGLLEGRHGVLVVPKGLC